MTPRSFQQSSHDSNFPPPTMGTYFVITFQNRTPPHTHTHYVYKGTYGNLVTFPEGVEAGSLTFGKMRCVVIFRLTEIAAAAFHL